MLWCGRWWQPRTIDRVVQTLPTSTRVARVITDQGPAFLKGMGNPAGNCALASEVVAGELAHLLGLRVPNFAIVPIDLDIPMVGCGLMERGPAFASEALPGTVADGSDLFLSELARPRDVALLVVFDTWVRNFDRCPPEGALDPEPSRDNLFFTAVGRKFSLVALDHSHCFVEGEIEVEIGDAAAAADDRVFGLFPEFKPFIDEGGVLEATDRLAQIDAVAVDEIVRSVPTAWGPSPAARDAWVAFIVARAQTVAAQVPGRLLEQVRLAF